MLPSHYPTVSVPSIPPSRLPGTLWKVVLTRRFLGFGLPGTAGSPCPAAAFPRCEGSGPGAWLGGGVPRARGPRDRRAVSRCPVDHPLAGRRWLAGSVLTTVEHVDTFWFG